MTLFSPFLSIEKLLIRKLLIKKLLIKQKAPRTAALLVLSGLIMLSPKALANGGALVFSGDDYFKYTGYNVATSGGHSMQMWVKKTATPVTAGMYIVQMGSVLGISHNGFPPHSAATAEIAPYQGSLGGIDGANPYFNYAWQHIVITRDPTETSFTVYINGISYQSGSWPLPASPAPLPNEYAFGSDNAQWNGGEGFIGQMDEFAYWDRELSAADVAVLYNSGKGFPVEVSKGAYAGDPYLYSKFDNNTTLYYGSGSNFTPGSTATASLSVVSGGVSYTTSGLPAMIDNTAPTMNGSYLTNGAVDDDDTISPFPTAGVYDADGDTLTLYITYTGANGTLSGTGLSGSAGSYTLSGSHSTITSQLQALTFTPTENLGAAVVTTFSLRPYDGSDWGGINSSTQVTATNNTDDPTTGSITLTNTTPNQGDVIGVTNGLSDPDGTVTLSTYQWRRDGVDIALNGTSATYTTTQDDVNKAISVYVTYSDTIFAGNTVSADTTDVANVNDLPNGSVTITNKAIQVLYLAGRC